MYDSGRASLDRESTELLKTHFNGYRELSVNETVIFEVFSLKFYFQSFSGFLSVPHNCHFSLDAKKG
jgi:hypothetical protein